MIDIINFLEPVSGNFLVDIIKWLVGISSSVAVGVILFTILLKLITLPFDFMSRYSMRKNSVKMEEMSADLEKLQKQYAGDKALYQQKMMALYKKNGYSMWGSCLPTIITLVIFIVAINAFTSYSQFQNRQYFYNMSLSYNNVVYEGIDDDGVYISRSEKGEIVIDDQALYQKTSVPVSKEGGDYTINVTKGVNSEGKTYYEVNTSNGYIKYRRYYTETAEGVTFSSLEYHVDGNLLLTTTLKNESNNYLKLEDGQEYDSTQDATAFVKEIGQIMSAKTYREEKTSFLWVKNIWVTDSPLSHPVEGKWDSFKNSQAYPSTEVDSNMSQEKYSQLIAKLTDEVNAPNGYFILVVLTAGVSLIMQIVMTKSQKAQMKYQSVDGQGAKTQKIMTWIMPIMMAVFSFMYTAAFSVYIIISNTISILTTLLINKIVSIKLSKAKKEDKRIIRGRVYTKKK